MALADVPLPVSTETPTEPPSASTEADGVDDDDEPSFDDESPLGVDPPPPAGGVAGGALGVGDPAGVVGDAGTAGLVVGSVRPLMPTSERLPGALLALFAACVRRFGPCVERFGAVRADLPSDARVVALRAGTEGGVRWWDWPGVSECHP